MLQKINQSWQRVTSVIEQSPKMLREDEIPEVSTSSVNGSDAKNSEKASADKQKVESTTTQSLFDSLFIQNACNESYSEHMNVDKS